MRTYVWLCGQGNFCADPATTGTLEGCIGEASIGLMGYCLYPQIPQYNNETYAVCFEVGGFVCITQHFFFLTFLSATRPSSA